MRFSKSNIYVSETSNYIMNNEKAWQTESKNSTDAKFGLNHATARLTLIFILTLKLLNHKKRVNCGFIRLIKAFSLGTKHGLLI